MNKSEKPVQIFVRFPGLSDEELVSINKSLEENFAGARFVMKGEEFVQLRKCGHWIVLAPRNVLEMVIISLITSGFIMKHETFHLEEERNV